MVPMQHQVVFQETAHMQMDLHAHNLEPATIYQRISSFSGEVGNHQIPNFQKTKIHQNTHKTLERKQGRGKNHSNKPNL